MALRPFLSRIMNCFSRLFAKKPSPRPSRSSGNIEESGEALFNDRYQDFSSENDPQTVQSHPVEVAAMKGENYLCNVVAGAGSTQIIVSPYSVTAQRVHAGEGAVQVLGTLGTYVPSGLPPPPYPGSFLTQPESPAEKNGGL